MRSVITRQDILRRQAAFENTIFNHPAKVQGLGILEDDLARSEVGLKAKARLVTGWAGAGKTTLLDEFIARHPHTKNRDGDVKNVVVAEFPGLPTQKAAVRSILAAMGYDLRTRSTANEIVDEIALKVELLSVKMIIIDEAHHIIEGHELEPVTEFLKSLINRIKCHITLVGLPHLSELKQAGFGEFARRLLPTFELAPYDWESPEGRVEFFTLLAKFERNLELPDASNLHDSDLAARMYVASLGNVGLVSKLLSEALGLALELGHTRIDRKLLAYTYALFSENSSSPAPIDFHSDFEIDEQWVPHSAVATFHSAKIDPATNPFECDPGSLGSIWNLRKSSSAPPAGKRLRRAKGKGPKPPSAFG